MQLAKDSGLCFLENIKKMTDKRLRELLKWGREEEDEWRAFNEKLAYEKKQREKRDLP